MTTPETAQDEAFKRYVVPELDVMHRVARSLTKTSADAEDLVQDTLIRAYRAIERFDGRYPRAWLLTILRNTQINRVRKKRPELLDDPDLTFERHAASEDQTLYPEQVVVDPTYDAEVERALEALPPKFRQVIEVVDVEGRSYQEAADRIGVPIGTIMSRLHRARKRMRDQLDRAGFSRRRF